jgi:hypothetical protein
MLYISNDESPLISFTLDSNYTSILNTIPDIDPDVPSPMNDSEFIVKSIENKFSSYNIKDYPVKQLYFFTSLNSLYDHEFMRQFFKEILLIFNKDLSVESDRSSMTLFIPQEDQINSSKNIHQLPQLKQYRIEHF